MKKVIIIFAAALLSACAKHYVYESSPQFYRAKGQDDQTKITGKIEQSRKINLLNTISVDKITIYFDGIEQIVGYLDDELTGELEGKPFNGKKTSASCSSKSLSNNLAEIRCIVFIDNERAATIVI
ncbi:hypothetical protein [Methylophilus aquaticus]|uniref:Lipoprotein n=1 Tax=Methylophilus aquaticus TaxID=1971610 RepID=A0ABT9JXB6_9PROT|nr:hypothetical protein [Methylophilus aquaticus]MDP8568615.1 hypothetical protein [Methylophilus aquaticus]